MTVSRIQGGLGSGEPRGRWTGQFEVYIGAHFGRSRVQKQNGLHLFNDRLLCAHQAPASAHAGTLEG